jgi:hypothetical protein
MGRRRRYPTRISSEFRPCASARRASARWAIAIAWTSARPLGVTHWSSRACLTKPDAIPTSRHRVPVALPQHRYLRFLRFQRRMEGQCKGLKSDLQQHARMEPGAAARW